MMIFGDPSRFALSWDSVVAWDHQQPRFYEGLFLTYVNGLVVPWKNFGSSDIWFNLRAFNNAVIEHKRQKENKEFLGNDASVYRNLLFYSFGDESNWEYRADSDAITDAGFCLFLIKKKDEEIIYVGFGDEFLTSARIDLNEFSVVVNNAINCFFEKYPAAINKRFL